MITGFRCTALFPFGQLLPLGCIEQIQLAHTDIAITGQPLQQDQILAGHPSDQGCRQRADIVNEAQTGRVRCGLTHFQGQLELCVLHIGQEGLHHQTGMPRKTAEIFLQIVESHLKERVDTRHALRVQDLDKVVEGHACAGLHLPVMGAGAGQQIGQTQLVIDLQLQHDGVDEAAHHAIEQRHVTIGHRHPDTDTALAAVARQQQLPGGEQQHERRGTESSGPLPYPGEQRQRHGRIDMSGGAWPRAGLRAGSRERQRGMLPSQFRLPPCQIVRREGLCRMGMLPDGVIDVLRRRCPGRPAHLTTFSGI